MTGTEMSQLELHEDYPEIVVVICLLSLFSIIGTIGNAFVLYVYSRKKEKTTTAIFILTLAGTDFFTCLIIIPFTIIVEYAEKRINNDSACKVYQFLITSNVPFSAFVMVVIAGDRYLKICRPYNHILNTKMAKQITGLLFVFAVVLGIITSLAHGVYNSANIDANGSVNETNETVNLSFNMSYGINEEMYFRFNFTSTAPDPTIQRKMTFLDNLTNMTIIKNSSTDFSQYDGFCIPNDIFISRDMRNVFQKFYASLFLVCFIFVFILYSLVLQSLVVRRARKAKKTFVSETCTGHNMGHLAVTASTHATKSTMTDHLDITTLQVLKPERKEKIRLRRTKSTERKQCSANLKTAGILFIVTVVFILAFLPAWLMATRVISGNIIVFYMHFCYNVANPIIYAFFNANFRKEIKSNCQILHISFDKQTL